ncbi:MAG: glycoside hydrolase family 2 TIM barrel-domain containing protein [Chloroflexota bacterium]
MQINDNWRFQFEDEAAESVTLPHSWNALDAVEPDLANRYRRGTGWYERVIEKTAVSASSGQVGSPTRRRFIHFEAASQTAQVWLDGVEIGNPIGDHQWGHVGGYSAFDMELPAHSGQLRVAVNNTPDIHLAPSDRSDFFLYGGLTRNVWLYDCGAVKLEKLHIVTNWSEETAMLTLHGECDVIVEGTELVLNLIGAGETVWQATYPISAKQFTLDLPDVANPERWSPENPALYTLTAQLLCQGELSDEVVERIGFRTYHFPEGGPFYLNGERLLLRGTHRHEDWAGRASAVPDTWSRRELEQIKAGGFNFIRLGHYPQADAVLDVCDELGLIVWEEIPWCRGGIGGDLFKERVRTMLREMVAQHFNRPSIIFWGLGNELDWESDHPTTTDDDVYAFLGELHELCHQLDPSRMTALRRYDRGADIVDAYSPSIWSGWYRGPYKGYETVLREAMSRFPRLIHTEWGGDNHVGRHNVGPHLRRQIVDHTSHEEIPGEALSSMGEPRGSLDSDWSESYILDVMEWHLQVQNRLPKLAGTAQWAFKDFGTPLRPENPIPYVNQKGLVDRSGQPKDVYFLFQAYQTNEPVCHIESPTWPIRAGNADELQRVRVYSNCERVELFVNGRSHHTKTLDPTAFPARGLVWFVPMQQGANEIRAVASTTAGQTIEHTITQTLVPVSGEVAAIEGQWEKVVFDEKTAVLATIQLVDQAGIPVLSDERRVQFALSGNGQLLVNQGTPTGSGLVETANGRAAIHILGADETTILQVRADNLPTYQLKIRD